MKRIPKHIWIIFVEDQSARCDGRLTETFSSKKDAIRWMKEEDQEEDHAPLLPSHLTYCGPFKFVKENK